MQRNDACPIENTAKVANILIHTKKNLKKFGGIKENVFLCSRKR